MRCDAMRRDATRCNATRRGDDDGARTCAFFRTAAGGTVITPRARHVSRVPPPAATWGISVLSCHNHGGISVLSCRNPGGISVLSCHNHLDAELLPQPTHNLVAARRQPPRLVDGDPEVVAVAVALAVALAVRVVWHAEGREEVGGLDAVLVVRKNVDGMQARVRVLLRRRGDEDPEDTPPRRRARRPAGEAPLTCVAERCANVLRRCSCCRTRSPRGPMCKRGRSVIRHFHLLSLLGFSI
jgi:hypothetical protein